MYTIFWSRGERVPISLRSIARIAGVSPATVSNVLNGHPHVAPATRERVLQVVEQEGYKHSPSAKARLLVVFPYVSIESTQPGQSYFVHEIILGLQQSLARSRQSLTMAGVDGVTPPATIPELADCQASFVVGGAFEPAALEMIGSLLRVKPLVVVGTTALGEKADCVVADNAGGIEKAVYHLADLGHRRIALLNGLPSSSSAEEKRVGYRRALQKLGLVVDERYDRVSDYTIANAQRVTREFLQLPIPPTAILVADDPMAIGVMQGARELGLRVPDDLSVVGYGDDYPGIDPPLTTVRVNKRRLGELSHFVMQERLKGDRGTSEAVRVVLSTQLIVRGSTGPAPSTHF